MFTHFYSIILLFYSIADENKIVWVFLADGKSPRMAMGYFLFSHSNKDTRKKLNIKELKGSKNCR